MDAEGSDVVGHGSRVKLDLGLGNLDGLGGFG